MQLTRILSPIATAAIWLMTGQVPAGDQPKPSPTPTARSMDSVIVRSRGFTNLVLNARASAVGFYEKLGYAVIGEEFIDVTIAHVRMVKGV
jgi:hypothetical protein